MPFTAAARGWPGLMDAIREEEPGEQASAQAIKESPGCGESAEKTAEETRHAFAAGRERGQMEGRQLEREAHAVALKAIEDERTQKVMKLLAQFTQDRDGYLHAVEEEVVKLALAVAARILRREAQMDPLLLMGAVRAALGQLAGSSEVRLRVPAGDLGLWEDALALLPNLAVKPKVIVGEGMRLGDCVIETALGSVDLGVRSQLGEIERGFFDGRARFNSPAAGRQTVSVAAEDEA